MRPRGVNVVLIGQLTPRHAAHFRRRQEIELPVLADEDRVSYKAAGAKVATFSELLGPKVVAKGLLTALRRRASARDETIGHPAQLGGAMRDRARRRGRLVAHGGGRRRQRLAGGDPRGDPPQRPGPDFAR